MAKHTPQVEAVKRMIEPRGSVHLNSKKLAEIKKWDVGEDYKVQITMRQTSKSEFEDDKGVVDASFEIKSIKVL